MFHRLRVLIVMLLAAAVLAGCQVSEFAATEKHLAPVPGHLKRKMAMLGMDERAPILIRIFKEEDELEVWKKKRDGTYGLLQTYEICAWSGDLGPKLKEGDRQSPEGFYIVHPYQMNPNSSYHLAFNLGFPNAYDRSHGRTGSFLMVHGDCSSRGCYAMEDDQIEEIYALARDAFRGGQRAFQVQAFPFHMTPENMARHHDSQWLPFWKMLKEGYDHFEVTKLEPKVDVCGRRYVFNTEPRNGGSFSPTAECPIFDVPQDIWVQVASKQREDDARLARLIAAKERRDMREEEWEARRALIASFFGSDERTGGDAAEAASIAAAVRGGDASPAARSPLPQLAAVPPADRATTRAARPERPAETARATTPSAPADVATVPSTAGVVPVPRAAPERPASAAPSSDRGGFAFRVPNPFGNGAREEPRAATDDAEPATPVASTAAPPQPAPAEPAPQEERKGFVAGVAEGTKNLMGAAGSGVGSLWRGATGLFD